MSTEINRNRSFMSIINKKWQKLFRTRIHFNMQNKWNWTSHNSLAIKGAQKILKNFSVSLFHEKISFKVFCFWVVLSIYFIKKKNKKNSHKRKYFEKMTNPPILNLVLYRPTPIFSNKSWILPKQLCQFLPICWTM